MNTEIIVRKLSRYKEAIIVDGNTRIELGVLDDEECVELAAMLKDAAEALMENIEVEP